jgi:NAD-dependent SIR2 family protein deacetylase
MLGRTVVVFGAGATKACGGPLTNEILHDLLKAQGELEREGYLALVDRFLVENFNVPPTGRRLEHFPPLPLVLSLVDTAVDRGDSFGREWNAAQLRVVRDGLEYGIFALLERRLRRIQPHYKRFLASLYAADPEDVTLISLNYDIIADNALPAVVEREGRLALPDYCCDIATDGYRRADKFGKLIKLHGSLNWLYCPNCHRLDLGVSRTGRRTVKVLNELYRDRQNDLDAKYGCHGSPCRECGTFVRPVLITPTHLKDYRNPHIARIWYEAARALREAKHVIFVGYSMPEDDVEVIYLFKRGLVDVDRVTVVEQAGTGKRAAVDVHPVGRRYRALFGDRIEWWPQGFSSWIDHASANGFAAPRARRRAAAAPH